MALDPGITIRQLVAFLTTAEAGSLRRAAEMGGTSQPALSAQIAGLEKALGLRLFERRSSGVLLTPDGRAVQAMARRTLDAADEIAGLRNRGRGCVEALLSIGVSSSIGPYVLPGAARVLHREHPNLRLIVREANTRRLTLDLLSGVHDLIVTQLPLSDVSIQYEAFCRERLFLMMAADHPLSEQDAVSLPALSGWRILTLGPDFALSRQVERLCQDAGASCATQYEGSSMDALRIMCALGRELAIVPEFYVRSEVRSDNAVAIRPIRGRSLSRTLVLAWRQSQGSPAFVPPLAAALRNAVERARAESMPAGALLAR